MTGIIDTRQSPYAKVRAVNMEGVRWRPGFWDTRFEQCHRVTLPHLYELMDDPARGHALTNLKIAAGLERGEFAGTHWQDEWVFKWLEAASYVYGMTHDAALDRRMDEVIAIVARAQQPDGYLATQTIVRGWPRYQRYQHHEVYVMGHLLTAACAHHRATGKTGFLDVARRVGDYLHRTFMPPRDPALAHIVFNPSQIMGLVELYRTTGEQRYLAAASAFVDMHGAAPGGIDLMQDRVPLREETQVVGHMVLGTYLYAGATDTYLETGDTTLLEAMDRLWHDLVQKRMYVHGGVCAVHRGFSVRPREVAAGQTPPGSVPAAPPAKDSYPGHLVNRHLDDVHEAAGDDYELPNSTAYNETCAQIGNFLWNWRLLAAEAEARHADVMELNLYNSILPGIGLDGQSWFYTNPLRFHAQAHKLLSQDAYQRFQPGRVHVCCPSNLVRTIAGLHGYLYGVSDEGLWVHHYAASEVEESLPGGKVKLAQETDYPWSGTVTLTVQAAPGEPFAVKLRIPAWVAAARAPATIAVNGERVDVPAVPGTYATVERTWRSGDTLTVELPMDVRLIEGNPRVESVRNQVAVARGPLIYCLESPDLPVGVAVADVFLPADAQLVARDAPEVLGGVTVLEGEADVLREPAWGSTLYRPLVQVQPERLAIRLIPYFAWANRGVSEMTVWLPLSRRAAP